MSSERKVIVAAGGVVWRAGDNGTEVLLVHRQRYDDWTFPKGKLEPGETELAGAVREVREETAAEVAVQQRITSVKYLVEGVRKRVTYWSMRYISGEFIPNDEVDSIEWAAVHEAAARLTYDHDRTVLADFTAMPAADALLLLVRHAKAGKRSAWRDDDKLRPLDSVGEQQATALVALLSVFAPTQIYSADRARCIQTVEPLAAELGHAVQVDAGFSDENYVPGSLGTQLALLSLAKPGDVTVVGSQGVTIPALVEALAPVLVVAPTRKAAWWALTVVDGEVVAADHYDPPVLSGH